MRGDARQLFTRLIYSLGSENAKLELKWMKQNLSAVSDSDSPNLPNMLHRRLRGEPLQYILGTTPFGPLDLLTRPPTLIPRPETEDWALRLADMIKPTSTSLRPKSVLDLCTGSGCIPLLLCHLCPPASIRAYGVDISQHAIRLAIDNAARCDIPSSLHPSFPQNSKNVFIPVLGDIRDPNLFSHILPPFDIITANPPYITKRDYDLLPLSVKDYEDPVALLADSPYDQHQDGLSFYRLIARIISQKGILRPGSIVALEVGQGQADAVEHLLQQSAALRNTQVWIDPWNIKRVVIAHA